MSINTTKVIIDKYREYILGSRCNFIQRASIVNNVDLTSFNYSVEEPILREYGSLYDIKHDYSFGTVQPCIRTRDAAHIFDDDIHLSQFTIMPLPFSFYAEKRNLIETRVNYLQNALCFFRNIGIDLDRLCVTFFPGAYFDSMIKSSSHIYIEPDIVTKKVCLNAGIPEKNLIAGKPFDNFLCTSGVSEKFYAGYRYEIFYKGNNGALFEIATGETLLWLQETKDSTTELLEMPGFGLVIGLGLERCLMASENKDRIFEISIIASLMEVFIQNNIQIEVGDSFMIIDALRALHIIVCDGGGYSQLNRNQRNHVRVFLKRIAMIMLKYSIPEEIICDVLVENARIQFWLGDMSFCTDKVMSEIKQYCGRASFIRDLI